MISRIEVSLRDPRPPRWRPLHRRRYDARRLRAERLLNVLWDDEMEERMREAAVHFWLYGDYVAPFLGHRGRP